MTYISDEDYKQMMERDCGGCQKNHDGFCDYFNEPIDEAYLIDGPCKVEASMIPNGKEMTWKGHHLVFESEPNPCRGCFFADKDECPDCDEGAWVEDDTEATE